MNAATMIRLTLWAVLLPMFCAGGAELDESRPDPLMPVFVAAQDAFRPARGMGISFTRVFSSVRDSRLDRGALGYGWCDNFSIRVEKKGRDKLLIRLPSGDKLEFLKEDDAWHPQDWRDATKMTETSAAFVFSFESGTVRSFSKENGRTSFIQDNKGNVLSFTWDGERLQRVAHTDGQYLSFAYSSDGFLASVVDDCGRRTEYLYKDDLLVEVKSSDGLVTSYDYFEMDGSPSSRAIRRVGRPDGTVRAYEFDEQGLVSAIVANGVRTEIRRRNGRTALIVAPDGGETKIEFGEAGEILQTTDALANMTRFAYGEDGLLETVISPSGKEASLSYDSRGRIKSVKSPSGANTAFRYEKTFGNLALVTDANGQSVSYDYDDVGRGVAVMHPDGTASKVGYGPRGDAVSVCNRRGQSIKMDYDAQGRLVRKTWPDGRTFAYAYDMRGNLVSAMDSETGLVRMEYDSAGRMTRISYPKGRGLAFKYDAAGRLVARTLFDGTANSSQIADVELFAYNDAGRVASVSDGSGRKYIENAYDSKTGRLTRRTCGNGVASEYGYDQLGRIVSIRHSGSANVGAAFEYSYDKDGKCRMTRSDEGDETYEYDADGQLTSIAYPDRTKETFKYDAVGNRAFANGVMYAVNALNQYTEISGEKTQTVAEYDLDGNLISMADGKDAVAVRYSYDVQNRLVAVTNEAKGVRWSCQYDALGNRVSVTDNGVTTERVMIPGALASVAAEYVDGKLAARHVVVGAIRIATVTTNHSTLSTTYYHGDLIGSVRLVTNGEGKEVVRASYAAFGSLREGGRQGVPSAGYVGMFGVETDSTGLLFMRNRYYSPVLGRFIQPDPIGLNGEDVNWYRYCVNDPVLKVDFDGFKSFAYNMGEIATGFGMVIGGVISGMSTTMTGPIGVAGAIEGVGGGGVLIYDGVRDIVRQDPVLSYVAEHVGAYVKGVAVNTGKAIWNYVSGKDNGVNSTFAQEIRESEFNIQVDGNGKWTKETMEDIVEDVNNSPVNERAESAAGQREPGKRQHTQRNRRERKDRGSDDDSEDSDDWCECDNPTVPANTDSRYYFVCTTCNKVRRKNAKVAKRAERQMQRRGREGVWQGDPQKVKQAQSVE